MTPAADIEPQNEGIDATQDHPATAADPSEQDFTQIYGPRFEKLPQQLVMALRSAVTEFQQQEQYARRREVMRDRRNRYYERGIQHLYETTQGLTAMVPGQVCSGSLGKGQAPQYIDDYNVWLPYQRLIMSVLSQNPPGIAFRPTNPNLEEDTEAADTAENYAKIFDRANDVKGIQVEQIRMMCLSGRTISWTRTEADAQLFGQNADGSAKRMEIATIHGTLESKVPILAKSQKEALYTFLYDDPDVKQAKEQYPGSGVDGVEFAKQIQPGQAGLGESEYERTARLGILQGTRSQAQQGDAASHVVTRMNCWLRPAAFNGDKFDEPFDQADDSELEDNGDGTMGAPTVKKKLNQLFPNGCHAVFVGETYVGSWSESMDDALDIAFPYKGDGMSRQAIMDLFVVIQDTFNDVTNGLRQASDVGWPSTWVDGEDQDIDAITNQKADPYAIRVRKARKDMALAESFFREPDLVLPASLMQWIENMVGPLAQLMLSTPPVLFGQGDADAKTASGTAQLKAQAMGAMGLIWGMMQRQWARIRYQGALFAGKNPDYEEEIVVATGDQAAPLQLAKLSKGHFGAYPDEDSSFPETTPQKRQNLDTLLTMAAASPDLQAQIVSSPDNWRVMSDLHGFSELKFPQAEARDKQLIEIEELLQQSPIPPAPEELEAAMVAHAAEAIQGEAMAAQTGQQAPPPPPFDPMSLLKPSVPVDELDYHPWEFEKGKEWLSSDACRRQLALRTQQYPAGNKMGVLNVKLHTLEHQKFMAQAAAMMAPPAPPAPVGKPAPHTGPPKPPAALSAPPAPIN